MGNYRQFREALENQLIGLAQFPELEGPILAQLIDKLRQNRFNLVVLGAFKRGKSTLINALLGEPIMPMAIVPLTSVVTVLGHGDKLNIQVIFQNGAPRQITRQELEEYITEKGNPRNQKGVREVNIAYPSDYLQDGVRIIDTPGVGSVYSHNSEVAYNYLPQVDAAIFVVTVDPPLSFAEQEFIKDIREYVHKLFFALNKVDYVEEAQRREALEFTNQVLQANLATDQIMIFPLAAKLALEGKVNGRPELLEASLLSEFENHLRQFLYKEKGRVLLISCISGALKTIADSTLALKVEGQASSMPLKELAERIARFDQELQGLEKERELSLLLLDGRIKGVITEVEADLDAFKQETIIKLRRQMEEAFRQKSQVAGDLRKETEEILFGALRDVFTTWRRQEIDKLSQKLADTHQDFATRINAILERLTQLTARIFDFSLRGFAAEEAFPDLRQFWFRFREEPVGLEILQMTVTSLLPRALTKGLLFKKLLENVTELVDKHCGRLRYDFNQRLGEIARDFRQTWITKIDDTTQSIRQALERALAQKRTDAQATATRVGFLDLRLTEILRAEAELLALKAEIAESLP
jgi:hypothetical protein